MTDTKQVRVCSKEGCGAEAVVYPVFQVYGVGAGPSGTENPGRIPLCGPCCEGINGDLQGWVDHVSKLKDQLRYSLVSTGRKIPDWRTLECKPAMIDETDAALFVAKQLREKMVGR
jgi:hypothetical protein